MLSNKEGKLKKSQSLTLVDLEGKEYKSTIVSREDRTDLCLLKTDKLKLPSVKLATKPPEYAEKVFNVAAPVGLFSKQMVPMFYGYYAGTTGSPFALDTLSSIFTVPLTGGSSGSPVLNMNGELVGLIHSKLVKFDNIAFAVTLDQIRLFLHRSLMKQNFHNSSPIPTFKD